MSFLYFKALHIIFVITWFAGLFYIARLFIYHREALDFEEPKKTILTDQYKIMEKRLWYIITWPSCVLALFFGLSLLPAFMPLKGQAWLTTKLMLVLLLVFYHLKCGQIYKQLQKNQLNLTSQKLRFWNELPVLLLFSIVFLVVLKSMIGFGQGLAGLLVLMFLLVSAIKIYQKKRESNNS